MDTFHKSANGDLASELQQQGKFDDAIAAYRKQLEITPFNKSTHKGLGILLAQLNRDADATKELEETVAMPPDDPEVKIVLARVYARNGIAVYWIVNVADRVVEVFTDPSGPVLVVWVATAPRSSVPVSVSNTPEIPLAVSSDWRPLLFESYATGSPSPKSHVPAPVAPGEVMLTATVGFSHVRAIMKVPIGVE